MSAIKLVYPKISIHALREESDTDIKVLCLSSINFNPRPPRGERPPPVRPLSTAFRFQSTPSARRATFGPGYLSFGNYISIHALREESDSAFAKASDRHCDFNPRPPRGERLIR